jgi:hypothetical protein
MNRRASHPLVRSFERHLRAANRSGSTLASYVESIRQADRFLTARGRTLLDARRRDLEAFLAALLSHRSAATAATRHKVLRIFYRWLKEEDEITTDPMARVKAPIIPEQPVPGGHGRIPDGDLACPKPTRWPQTALTVSTNCVPRLPAGEPPACCPHPVRSPPTRRQGEQDCRTIGRL